MKCSTHYVQFNKGGVEHLDVFTTVIFIALVILTIFAMMTFSRWESPITFSRRKTYRQSNSNYSYTTPTQPHIHQVPVQPVVQPVVQQPVVQQVVQQPSFETLPNSSKEKVKETKRAEVTKPSNDDTTLMTLVALSQLSDTPTRTNSVTDTDSSYSSDSSDNGGE